jgi:uridine kinase
MVDVGAVADRILEGRGRVADGESMLVAVSGIDASGKGYLTKLFVEELQSRGVHAVGINVDGWLNLPEKRFDRDHPAEQFYRHAIRFEEMFEKLILPLKRERSIVLDADLAEETATEYHRHRYEFRDVDVIVLEGAYLLKRAYRGYYDLAFWVECSFETALERALQRGQEGLPPDDTVRAYETIYFPAERIHFARDDPRGSADVVIVNDDRIV